LTLSGQTGFTAMGNTIGGTVSGSGDFRLFPPVGLNLTGASFKLGLGGTIDREIGIADAIPQLASLENTPVIGGAVRWFNQRATLEGSISPSLGLATGFSQRNGNLEFSGGTGTLGLDLKGTLKVNLIDSHLSAKGWLAGNGSLTVGVPDPLMRQLDVGLQAGAELTLDALFSVGGFKIGGNASVSASYNVGCTWTQVSGVRCAPGAAASGSVSAARGYLATPVAPITHNYSRFGEYSRFLGSPQLRTETTRTPISVQQSILLSNVFPGAAPFLVNAGAGRLMLWAHQDPSLPVLQSTDIYWSYYDGRLWTTPAPILHDTRAELSPVAGPDRNGRIVAAWLRINDPAFSAPVNAAADLPAFYNQLEVVTSVFDPTSRTWGQITQLTDDDVMHTNLRLSSDGSGQVMLTWLSNPNAEFVSTSSSPSNLQYSRWDGSTWSSPSNLASGLVGVGTHAAAIRGNAAFVVVPRDPSPDLANKGLIDLYTWNGAGWSAASTFAAGGVDNRLPGAIYDSAGQGHVIWLRGSDLVHATLSDPTPRTVRAGSSSLAFYDTKLLTTSEGRLTLVWQQAVDNGPANIFAMLYDPALQTWSADRQLTQDTSLAHDVCGLYDAAGQMHLAYLATEIARTDQTVDLGGTIRTIENIPQDGRTDLLTLDHSLIVDLAVADKDIGITPSRPEPGQNVTLTLDVHNAGDFSVSNFLVNIYVADPETGGVLVASSNVDSLRAGDHRVLTFSFAYPASGGNIVAVVDPSNAIPEFSKSNNRATVYLANSPPDARVVASLTSGAPPLQVDFDASASSSLDGGPISFNWAFGDGSANAVGPMVSHTFTQSGEYSVTLAVTDSHGAVGTAVVTITVTGPPPPVIAGASISGKKLLVTGTNFDPGAVVLLNGVEQRTVNDDSNPTTLLICPKAGKKIASKDNVMLQVKNSSGALSGTLSFSRP
jgi:PKD repeat protein